MILPNADTVIPMPFSSLKCWICWGIVLDTRQCAVDWGYYMVCTKTIQTADHNRTWDWTSGWASLQKSVPAVSPFMLRGIRKVRSKQTAEILFHEFYCKSKHKGSLPLWSHWSDLSRTSNKDHTTASASIIKLQQCSNGSYGTSVLCIPVVT